MKKELVLWKGSVSEMGDDLNLCDGRDVMGLLKEERGKRFSE